MPGLYFNKLATVIKALHPAIESVTIRHGNGEDHLQAIVITETKDAKAPIEARLEAARPSVQPDGFALSFWVRGPWFFG